MNRLFFITLLLTFLFGCSSNKELETFGVRDSVWRTLTPQQQNLIIKSHIRERERKYEKSKSNYDESE